VRRVNPVFLKTVMDAIERFALGFILLKQAKIWQTP
jgi:hypothetical protein